MPEETPAADPAAPKRKPIWKREKVWVLLVVGAIPIINEVSGLNLKPATVFQIMAVIGSLAGFEMLADLLKVYQEAKTKREIQTNGKNGGGK